MITVPGCNPVRLCRMACNLPRADLKLRNKGGPVAEQMAKEVEKYLKDFVPEQERNTVSAIIHAAANMLADRLSTTPPSNMGPEIMDLTSTFFNVKVAVSRA